MVLFGILIIPYYIAFAKTITPQSEGTIIEKDVASVSFFGFLCSLFNIFDVIGSITYRGEDSPEAPLTSA